MFMSFFSVFKLVHQGIMEDIVHMFVCLTVRPVDTQMEYVHVKQSGWDGIAQMVHVYVFNDYRSCKPNYM